MSDIGELVLIIGDLHTPVRSFDLPACFQELLNTDKIRTVLCTGNLGSSDFLDKIKSLGQSVHIVRGKADESSAFEGLPDQIVTTIGKFKVGLVSSHSLVPASDQIALSSQLRKLEVDVLVSGGSHKSGIVDLGGRWLIDPGSATGAFNGSRAIKGEPVVPSFMLMAVQGESAVVYIYEEREGKTNVVMSEFSKGG